MRTILILCEFGKMLYVLKYTVSQWIVSNK